MVKKQLYTFSHNPGTSLFDKSTTYGIIENISPTKKENNHNNTKITTPSNVKQAYLS